ncbi:MAG: hypothetical protein ACYC26_04060 [Phycisphaerales bacterium]
MPTPQNNHNQPAPTPRTPAAEKSDSGCLSLLLFLFGVAAVVGIAIYLLVAFGGSTIKG